MPDRNQATAVEFVYRYFHDCEDSTISAVPHRIIRRTRQCVFVNVNSCYDGKDGKDIWNGRTHSLNRTQLEQAGSTSTGRRGGTQYFYASMHAFNRDNPRSSPTAALRCLSFFGLKLPTNVDSLKAVYRDRVKQAHPDHGGNPEDFQRLHSQYEAHWISSTGSRECVAQTGHRLTLDDLAGPHPPRV